MPPFPRPSIAPKRESFPSRLSLVVLLSSVSLGLFHSGPSVSAAAVADYLALSRSDSLIMETFGNVTTDPSALFYFISSQIFHAQASDTFPTLPLLRLLPSNAFYKLRSCERQDVSKCIRYGNASNGLPPAIQGIWWQDGILQPEELISSSGIWDPVQRKLSIRSSGEPVWGFYGDSSVKAPGGLYWLPSGAAHYNSFATGTTILEIVFNEEITFGQISLTLWEKTLSAPPILNNWTMTLQPDGSWFRQSSLLGIDSGVGRYYLRQAVDGRGQPGPYWKQYLAARNGAPFFYVDKISG